MKRYVGCVVLCTISFFAFHKVLFASDNNEEIKQRIIQESIATYPGRCACPYNVDKANRQCGKRSAYDRAGGHKPVCYLEDVTDNMVEDYKEKK